MIDPNALKVAELKAELTARGLPTKGLKKDLVERLEEALAAEGTTAAPAESESEPDVAPKEPKDIGAQDEQDQDMNTTTAGTKTATATEAKKIAHVAEPVPEPMAASAEADIVMDTALEPAAVHHDVPVSLTEGASGLEPVVGTPSLTQEGLIDTTGTSKKRSLIESSNLPVANRHTGSALAPALEPTSEPAKKKSKIIEINRESSERIAAAAKESVEADARRRSAAPSPSPGPGRSGSTASVSIPVAPAIEEEGSQSTSDPSTPTANTTISAPRSPVDEKKSPAGRRLDMRSLMERQIKLAALDRTHPEASGRSTVASPTTPKASVQAIVQASSPPPSAVDIPSETTRALVITNFVRPLTVNQVKRMLSDFGEVEVLWMDSIRTHCYVTFKETAAAEKAYAHVKGNVFPKETGKPLEPHFITPEAAAQSIEAAEEAQKSGKKPVIYTGGTLAPKRGAPVAIGKDDVEIIFRRKRSESPMVVQPADLFKMTKTQPGLYYKAVKEAPVFSTEETAVASDSELAPVTAIAEAN